MRLDIYVSYRMSIKIIYVTNSSLAKENVIGFVIARSFYFRMYFYIHITTGVPETEQKMYVRFEMGEHS